MSRDRRDDYEVGYGKPPASGRFRKGASGNPAGRPRGSRDFSGLLKAELDKKVAVREGGKVRRVSKRDALVATLVNKALQGDSRATAFIVTLLQRAEPEAARTAAADPPLEASDQEIIAAFLDMRRESKDGDG